MNLPASFIDYTRALLGNEEYEKLAAALQQEPPVSIRINKLRMKEEGLSSLTDSSAHFSFNKVPWASDGYYLDERLTFTFPVESFTIVVCFWAFAREKMVIMTSKAIKIRFIY